MPANRTVHKWAHKDREYLILLKLKYIRKYIEPIFNHLLAKTLSREGFQRGLSAPALDAQFREIKVGGKGHDIYAEIVGLSEARVEYQYRDHLREIKGAARSLKLRLEPTMNTAKRLTKSSSRNARKARMKRKIRIRRSETRDTSVEPVMSPKVTALKRRIFADKISPFFANNMSTEETSTGSSSSSGTNDNGTISPTTSITYDRNGNAAKKRPLLLFRSTENPNVFRARRFQDTNTHVPNPEKFGSKEYREWAIHHLERCDVYSSPFLSFAQAPRNAIRRIETARSENFDKKRFLVVFAFNDVEANAARNFGPGSGPHLARMLFDGELSDLPDGYTGAGEWLAHGFVDCRPLVVLDAAQVVKLAKAVRRFKTGDIAALADVRTCLQDVPFKWREAVAYVVLRNYCAKKLPPINSPAYRQMMRTIVTGNTGSTMELQDFARLSVTEEDSDYEQDDMEEDTDTIIPGQHLSDPQQPAENSRSTNGPVQAQAPASVLVDPSSAFARKSTISNLNSFNARLNAAKRSEQVTDPTPLWSPDPPEASSFDPGISEPSLAPRTENVCQRDTIDVEDDNEWDFVNDDLEDFFATSFPSAAKRVEHLQTASIQHARPLAGFNDENEEIEGEVADEIVDEDYVIPSIEVGNSYYVLVSGGRGNFLRGLTAHAYSEGSPVETPSKPPRKTANIPLREITSTYTNINTKATSTNAMPKSNTFQTPKSSTSTRPRQLSFERPRPVIDLTRVDTSPARGITAKPNQPMSMRPLKQKDNPKPSTNGRTTVPVIVRKTIVDYSV